MEYTQLALIAICAAILQASCTDAKDFGNFCYHEGNFYEDGSDFPSADGCNECTCIQGTAACTDKECGCVRNGKHYTRGEAFMDGCYMCMCGLTGVECRINVCDNNKS
eukprot:GHVU01175059.1.p1 GENE.GHVU01175059.1~~GHVU01175059.1.p1  ORF type:complete len:108 (+),score=10.62 GHVU01175059.1:51-374(+)